MAMKMEGVAGGKLGNTNYTMVEAKFNGRVVWPTAFTYVVTSVTVNYTGGVNYIKANGSNWAYLTGTVEKRSGSTVIETLYNQSLTPTLVSGTYSSYFYIEGTRIRANSLGTEETAIEYYVGVRGTYGTSGASSTVYTYLQRNQKTAYGSPIYGEKVYGATTDTGSPHDYYISSLSSSNGYTSSSSPCPASGGSTTVSYYAATHLQDTITPWTRTVTQYYTYTALDEPVASTTTETGSDPGVRTVNDTPTITRYSGDTNITISGNTVTIPNRGTNEGSARNTTFRAVNGDKSASITIYQQENVATTTYVYDLAISISETGNLSYQAGNYDVTGRSRRTPTTTYTSNVPPVVGNPEDVASAISTTNCTANDGNGNPITSVSGYFGFYIQTTKNSTGSTRTVSVSIAPSGVTPVSDSRTQDAEPAQPYIAKADLMPFIATFNGGNFVNGKTYTNFSITGSHNTSSATLQDVWFKYRVNNSIDYSVRIGELQVSEPSSFDLPELIPYSGYTLPTFKAGETYGYNDRFSSGDTVYAWFTVGNKGIIGQLDTHENSPYYVTIP